MKSLNNEKGKGCKKKELYLFYYFIYFLLNVDGIFLCGTFGSLFKLRWGNIACCVFIPELNIWERSRKKAKVCGKSETIMLLQAWRPLHREQKKYVLGKINAYDQRRPSLWLWTVTSASWECVATPKMFFSQSLEISQILAYYSKDWWMDRGDFISSDTLCKLTRAVEAIIISNFGQS